MALDSTYSKMKETGKHGVIYGLTNTLVTAVGFILIPIYTRYILPTDYGILALVMMTSTIFGTIFSLSIHSAVFRFYFDRDNEKYRKTVAGTALILSVFTASLLIIIGIFVTPMLSLFLLSTDKYSDLFLILFIEAGVNFILQIPMALLRARRKSKIYAVFNIVNFVLRLIVIIYLVVFMLMGIYGIAIGRLLVSILITTLLILYSFKDISFNLSVPIAKGILRFSSPLVLLNISTILLTWFDRYFLSVFRPLAEVGIYNLGYQISTVTRTFLIAPFILVWAPIRFEVMHHENANRYYSQIFTYFTFASMVFFLFISLISIDGIRIIATPDYAKAYLVIPMVTLGYVFYGLCNAVNLGMDFRKKTEYGAISVFIAAMSNIGLNIYFIPRYGMMGAAFTTLAAYIIMFILYYYFNHKLYPIKYDWSRVSVLFGLAGIVFLFGWLFPMDIIYDLLFWEPITLRSIILGMGIRFMIVLLYPVLLWYGSFFTQKEKESLKRLIKEFKDRVVSQFRHC